MTDEIFEKAKQLKNDIKAIKYQVEEKEKHHHWITTSTPDHGHGASSMRFQEELLDWLKYKIDEYQKEFDELKC